MESQEQASRESLDKLQAMRLEENADLHARLSTLESINLSLSRRITRLEEGNKGHVNDDPMSQLFSPAFMWTMIIVALAPIAIDLIKEMRSQQ